MFLMANTFVIGVVLNLQLFLNFVIPSKSTTQFEQNISSLIHKGELEKSFFLSSKKEKKSVRMIITANISFFFTKPLYINSCSTTLWHWNASP